MSHGKIKGNPFTKILGAGTFALLGLVAVTTFAPTGSSFSTSSLLGSISTLSAKVSPDVNLSAAQGVMQQAVQAVSPSKQVAPILPPTASTTASVATTTHTNTKPTKTP